VSITRLRVRHWRFLPGFAFHAWRSTRQARSAPGFRAGALANGPGLAFWTITAWDDEAALRAYRNSGAHRRAMPRLLDWCDEASYVHWQQDDATLPTPEAAFARLRDDGKLSKVRRPSPAHAAGDRAGAVAPRPAGAI
jgi:hypothetical protein